MTCIVGIIAEDGTIYIGGDSAGVGGYSLQVRKDKKIFHNGDYVFGGSGSFRMLQLLRYSFVPPVYDPSVDLEKFMSTTFINDLRDCLKDGGFAFINSNRESGGTFLVGIQGRLFQIEEDYQVGEVFADYDAVGCGQDIALGSLFATKDMQPRKRIELALQAAEAHNAGVRGPFFIESLEKK